MTRHLARLCLVALATSGLTACDEDMISLSEGDPSTLEVRAYVDADGDGSFQAGVDVPLADVTVTATAQGGEQLSATTGNEGLATFTSVSPGSYQLSIQADPPRGAVLATARNPLVSAPFRPQALSAEFRYTFLPGSVAGVVFRDDNGNDELDADDTPAPGVEVELFRGTSTSGEAVASTTTDGQGAFSLQGLRPGVHTLLLTPPSPTVEIVGGNEVTVTVEPDAAVSVPVQFTGNLVLSIAEAKEQESGSTIAVEGTIISSPDDRSGAIQDESGGIFFFDFDLSDKVGRPLEIGDVVRMIGELGAFRGEVQISPVGTVEILGTAEPPAPRPVTAAEINSGDLQGQLASIDGVVQSVSFFGGGDHLVSLTDASGGEFAVFVDGDTGISGDTWTEGETYGVTGVLGAFNDSQQLEPRFPADVRVGGSVITIAEARAAAEGDRVVVQGIVTSAPDARSGAMQDETAGIFFFDFDLSDLLSRQHEIGDELRLVGERGAFRGEIQVGSIVAAEIVGTPGAPDPRSVTGAELNSGEFQGQLSVIEGVVANVNVFGSGDHVVTLTDDAGTDFDVFVDTSATDITSGVWTEGERYRVIGVLGAFEATQQLEPRMPSDVENVN